ncbi:hypothetical protein DYBT9275_03221 [Dyadobacter sp. CECT 9275]|uniref:Uncharacterized protein n=1 Tax=Dyadobacter helix TaxID=2822344 RepID=A0A916NCD2_9BACT|nr:hypothetical protein [Dyadobacter sp. CECT 9275]CAG5003746.1 hypothetical protein DYBT9275_03221 [Dyadobacter sp. CECT 9275]
MFLAKSFLFRLGILPVGAAMLIFSQPLFAQVLLKTDFAQVQIDKSGQLASIRSVGGKEYVPGGTSSPVMSLFRKGQYLRPMSMSYDAKKGIATLVFQEKMTAKLRLEAKGAYLRLELLSLSPRNGVEAIAWGPFQVSISKLIGETVGIVRDDSFAVGVQALRINTLEGIPENGDDAAKGSFYEPLPGQQIPEELKAKIGEPVTTDVNVDGDMPEYIRMYRGGAAVKRPHGSEIRFFARDRRIPRTVLMGKQPQQVPALDADFAGSAIAIFACPETETLNTIEKIEIAEGLPHPMLDGVWIKRSPRMGEAYMLYEGNQLMNSLTYAKQLNFKLVHIGDVFKSWGHFGLETDRFDGAAAIRKFTEQARKDGISVGIHTLTTFTGVNDPYVSPVPNDSLQKYGSTLLTKDLGEDGDTLWIKDPYFFKNPTGTRTLRIGTELISYRKVSDSEPWKLTGLVRGQFKTGKAFHRAGSVVDKLVNNSYGGFLPDIHLQDQYARRLATVCRETGVDLMDFDGFEALDATGHGAFAENRFIDLWYRSLDRYRFTLGSNTSHYYWHIYSFMNWGEPWYSALRKSQVNYRIENQRYFERNLMPGMLGWFKLEESYRPEEIEWIQARSAGYNAGYLLRVEESIEKNGFKDEMFEAIREWQKARHAGAFNKEQIERLKQPGNEFHLIKKSDSSWELLPVSLQTGYEHKYRQVQTGEPVITRFKVKQTEEAQPAQFYVIPQATEGNNSAFAKDIRLEINGESLELAEKFKVTDRIFCDGRAIYLCDANWKKVRVIEAGKIPQWKHGENAVVVTCGFSGQLAPLLKFEFKAIGKAEPISAVKK